MAVFVMGTGAGRNFRQITAMLEKHILRTEGTPRKITARSDTLTFEAEREAFTGPFTTFRVTAALDDPRAGEMEKRAADMTGHCTCEKDGNSLKIAFIPPDASAPDETLAKVEAFCNDLKLPEVWRAEGDKFRVERISVELLFQAMVQYKASDVHLSPGATPVFRIDGETHKSDLMGAISGVQITELIHEVAPEEYWDEFIKHKQTSFNYHQAGLGYSRISAFIKSGSPHCTIRYLPETIPSFEDLHVPRDTMEHLADLHRGLVLVTGMTGSGKTTTVAALLDWINSRRSCHILTIENPIEFVHGDKKAIISQRTLGTDVESFYDAVTGALRHDPDVILIGEMRDPDTIRAAINAAATGHLVISTLHANTAAEVVNRIVSFFNPIERDLVKLQLRDSLKCVINQRLVPRIGGGRVPALEMMLNDVKAIADGIMEGSTDHIRIGMQQTVSHSFLFEHYLHKLYKEKVIDREQAQIFATDQSMFDQIHMGTYAIPRLDSARGH